MPERNNTGNKKRRDGKRRMAAQAAILFFLLLIAGCSAVIAEWLAYQIGNQEYSSLAGQYIVSATEGYKETTPEADSTGTPEAHLPAFSSDIGGERGPSPKLPDVSGLGNRLRSNPSQISGIDFTSLQAENPECAAWIEIPGTKVNYPVMYRPGDGQYYLAHTYGQVESKAGAIHLDGASAGLESRNLLIYGHTLLDGSMFSGLHKYKSQGFYETHPYIYLHLPDGSVHQYQIVACVLTKGEQESFYIWDFADEESAQAYYNLSLIHI